MKGKGEETLLNERRLKKLTKILYGSRGALKNIVGTIDKVRIWLAL